MQDEYQYLKLHRKEEIRKLMTTEWAAIQGKYTWTANDAWSKALEILELDLNACEELMCVVHQVIPGRTEANFILWTLLLAAYSGDVDDLSRLCSTKVRDARRYCDRPNSRQPGGNTWCWNRFTTPRAGIMHFAPESVPEPHPEIRMDDQGNPLPPPDCWAPPPPAPEAASTPVPPPPPPEAQAPAAAASSWTYPPATRSLPGRAAHRGMWL